MINHVCSSFNTLAFRILLKGGKIAVSAWGGGGGQALHAAHYNIYTVKFEGEHKVLMGGGGRMPPSPQNNPDFY